MRCCNDQFLAPPAPSSATRVRDRHRPAWQPVFGDRAPGLSWVSRSSLNKWEKTTRLFGVVAMAIGQLRRARIAMPGRFEVERAHEVLHVEAVRPAGPCALFCFL